VISGVDSATMNVLFIVVKDDEEILIPATEDFIVKIDSNEKCLYMKLPEGLLDTSFEE
jgi:16S rRNA processing protein RimM